MAKRNRQQSAELAIVAEPTVEIVATEASEPQIEQTATEPAEVVIAVEPVEVVEVVEIPEVLETASEPATEPPASEPTVEAPVVSRKHLVGAAVDPTVYGPFTADVNLRFLRPATLTCILHDEVRARGTGTCAQLVARLRDQAGHNRYNEVAPKSETLRPFSSVNYWLKVWSAAGILTATAPAATEIEVKAEEVASEPAA